MGQHACRPPNHALGALSTLFEGWHHKAMQHFDVIVIGAGHAGCEAAYAAARMGCHIHMDELLPHIPRFQNDAVVLMHFSQLYRPDEVRDVFAARCPPEQRDRFQLLLPTGNEWWD